jgi:carbapenam-3-carboxylate synthase
MGGFLVSYDPAAVDERSVESGLGDHARRSHTVADRVAVWPGPFATRGMATVVADVVGGIFVAYGDVVGRQAPPPEAGDALEALSWCRTAMTRFCGALCTADRLDLWTDATGASPLFHTMHASGEPCAAVAAKLLLPFVPGGPRLAAGNGKPPLGLSYFAEISAVPPGTLRSFVREGGRWIVDGARLHFRLPRRPACVGVDAACRKVRSALEDAVGRSVDGLDEVDVTLSGGVDSTAVAALAAARVGRVRTHTVGTPWGDEFAQAEATAAAVGTEHRTYVVEAEDVKRLLPEMIWLLETWDLATLQIAAATAFLYARLESPVRRYVLTGYGADLLFAGVVEDGLDEAGVEASVLRQVEATGTSNEFNPALPARFGITVRYPFWTPALVRIALGIPGRLKVTDGHVKYVLRRAVEPLVPDGVAWRAKRGIHEGTAMARVFADVLGSTDPAEQTRSLRALAAALFVEGEVASGLVDDVRLGAV